MTQPKKQKKPASKRPTGFTRISVNLPDDLLADLDAVAAADNRSRSNFLTYMIRRMITRAQVSQGLVLRDLSHAPYRKPCDYTEPDDAC